MQDPLKVRAKLSAARTRLILDTPFIGALVMHLPLVAADARRCGTVATDARALYFNPDYIAGLTLAQTQFVLAHEALHCALGHFARRAHRVKRRWDVACDHAVNLLLVDEGLKPPAGALLDPRFRGLSAEEIYPLIPEDTDEAILDVHAFDTDGSRFARVGNSGSEFGGATAAPAEGGAPLGELAREAAAVGWLGGGENSAGEAAAGGAAPLEESELELTWRVRLACAAQQAIRAGRMGTSWQRAIDDLIEPQLPWRSLLARYLMSVARDDYSFQRLSRREGEELLPRLHGAAVHLVAVIDVSGSITRSEIAEFVSELYALKGQVRARVTLHACDENLCPEGPWAFDAWEAMDLPETLGGGGGTRFTPVFKWIEDERLKPDVLLYFTDAQGEFPPEEPAYPMIWLVKGRAPVPWGERIQLN